MATKVAIYYDLVTGDLLGFTIPDHDWELDDPAYNQHPRLLVDIHVFNAMDGGSQFIHADKQAYIYQATGIAPPVIPDSPPDSAPDA